MDKFRPLFRLCSTLARIDIAASLVMTATLLIRLNWL
jgi:hypothetical protein